MIENFRKRLISERGERAAVRRRKTKESMDLKINVLRPINFDADEKVKTDQEKREIALANIQQVEHNLEVEKHLEILASFIKPHREIQRLVVESDTGIVQVRHKIITKTRYWQEPQIEGPEKRGKTIHWWGVELFCNGNDPKVVSIQAGKGKDQYKIKGINFDKEELIDSNILYPERPVMLT